MRKTIKVSFKITEDFAHQIDEMIHRWGFSTRAEFFRQSAFEFLRSVALAMPTDEVLKENTKAINRVHKRRPIFRSWEHR